MGLSIEPKTLLAAIAFTGCTFALLPAAAAIEIVENLVEARETGVPDDFLKGYLAPDGVVYFGGDRVYRFDGESWVAFRAGSMTVVQSMEVDDQGNLWAAGSNDIGYFEPKPGSLGQFRSIKKHLPDGARDLSFVWNVVQHGGKIYFATNSQVLRWDGREFKYWTVPTTRRIWLMKTGEKLFVATTKVGLCEFLDGELVEVIPPDLPGAYGPAWVEQQPDHLLVCCSGGLFRVYTGGRIVPATNNSAPLLKAGLISGATRVSPTSIAVSTVNSAVILIDNDGQVVRRLGRAQGVPASNCNDVITDRDGAIWIIATENLIRVDHSDGISLFGASTLLSREPVENIVQLGGNLYLSTNKGELYLPLSGDNFGEVLRSTESLEEMSSSVERLGDEILSARYDGVYSLSPGRNARKVFASPRDVLRLFPSRRHASSMYLADIYRIVRLVRHSENDYSVDEVIETAADVRSLVEDESGNRWIGTFGKGVSLAPARNPANAPTRVGNDLGLPRDMVDTDTLLIGGTVAVVASGQVFLKRTDSDHFASSMSLRGLRSIRVSRQNSHGDGWIAFAREGPEFRNAQVLAHLTPRADGGVDFAWYELAELGRIGTVRSLYPDHDAANPSLWIGGSDGVLRVELNKVSPSRQPRAPSLLMLPAGGDPVPAGAPAPRLPFSGNRVSFDFATTEYARRPLLRYQTRLVGLDHDWSAPTDNAQREYPYLDDRGYRFEVRTISAAGMASEPVSLGFVILPPWYRTPWAYLGYVAGAGVLFFIGVRVRVSTLRHRNQWLEDQVRQRTAELEKANAAKTEFVARVNHDIRNPINGVLGLTLALEQTPLTTDQRRMAGTIKQCAKFLAALVEEVLDFAEIELGNIRLRSEVFDPREALAACVATIEPLATAARCPILTVVDDDVPLRLNGDPARLQQILVNFLSNAVKFGAGAPIELTATPLHRNAEEAVVRFAVRDHGPGLEEAEQQRLFVKFSRGQFAERQKIKGTGLGLAVCRLLAEKMGGRVGIVSSPGAGAEFYTELPFAVSAPPAPEPAPAVSAGARVLVVEDEEYNAVSLLAMLRRMGFQVDRCADGLEALDLLGRHRYEMVFLDWELPHLNGIEVARRFRALEPPGRRTLLIATTAYASADKQQACRDAGMDEFVAKPLTPERIVAAIRGHSGVFSAATSILVNEDAPAAGEGVDLSLFSYIADKPDAVAAKVAEFLDTCERELTDLGSCLARDRGEELHRGAHRFLSQCRFVGATRMAEHALALENTAFDPAGPVARDLYRQLREEFAVFKFRLNACVAARAAGSALSQSRT